MSSLDRGHQLLHHALDVRDVEARAVVRAVGELGAEHLDEAPHATLANRVLGLHHQATRAHAHQHAVAPAIEGQRRAFDDVLGAGRARGHEARAHPLDQVVRGQLIGADDEHAPAAPHADPVLRHAEGHRGRGARRVDLGVRPANAEHLGKLGVSHGQHLEDEPAIELEVALLLPRLVVSRDLPGEVVEAGEGRREDDAGLIGHGKGHPPAVGQEAAGGGAAVVPHERDAGVPQGLDAGAHGQRRGGVEDLGALARDAEVLRQVERALPRRQPDHLVHRTNGLEARLADVALVQANDVLVEHPLAQALRHRLDEGLASQDTLHVAVVEHAVALAGQAQPRARDDDRARARGRGGGRRGRAATIEGHALVEETSEEPAQALVVGVAGMVGGTVAIRTHGSGCSIRMRGRLGGRAAKLGNTAQALRLGDARGIEAAHGIMERAYATPLRVVGGKTEDVGLVLEDVLGQGLQGSLRADLEEDARALAIAGLDAAHELDR